MSNRNYLGRAIEILLVEDSPSDALLTRDALRQGNVSNSLHHVEDGAEAMAFLRKEGDYADARRPDVILLDLNLPGMSGQEVLNEIRADESLSLIALHLLGIS